MKGGGDTTGGMGGHRCHPLPGAWGHGGHTGGTWGGHLGIHGGDTGRGHPAVPPHHGWEHRRGEKRSSAGHGGLGGSGWPWGHGAGGGVQRCNSPPPRCCVPAPDVDPVTLGLSCLLALLLLVLGLLALLGHRRYGGGGSWWWWWWPGGGSWTCPELVPPPAQDAAGEAVAAGARPRAGVRGALQHLRGQLPGGGSGGVMVDLVWGGGLGRCNAGVGGT